MSRKMRISGLVRAYAMGKCLDRMNKSAQVRRLFDLEKNRRGFVTRRMK